MLAKHVCVEHEPPPGELRLAEQQLTGGTAAAAAAAASALVGAGTDTGGEAVGKSFPCSSCGEVFGSKQARARHVKRAHKESGNGSVDGKGGAVALVAAGAGSGVATSALFAGKVTRLDGGDKESTAAVVPAAAVVTAAMVAPAAVVAAAEVAAAATTCDMPAHATTPESLEDEKRRPLSQKRRKKGAVAPTTPLAPTAAKNTKHRLRTKGKRTASAEGKELGAARSDFGCPFCAVVFDGHFSAMMLKLHIETSHVSQAAVTKRIRPHRHRKPEPKEI